jgi:serine/threonine protein kinase
MLFDIRQKLRLRGYHPIKRIADERFSRVYLVKNDSDYKILKFPTPQKTVWWDYDGYVPIPYHEKQKHLRNDAKALNEAKGMDGIAQIVDSFEICVPLSINIRYFIDNSLRHVRNSEYSHEDTSIAILKEFIEGKTMGNEDKILEKENQLFIRNAVLELHNRGIANLDLVTCNVIRATDGKPYIIDLGSALLYEEPSTSFKAIKSKDMDDLEKLFS